MARIKYKHWRGRLEIEGVSGSTLGDMISSVFYTWKNIEEDIIKKHSTHAQKISELTRIETKYLEPLLINILDLPKRGNVYDSLSKRVNVAHYLEMVSKGQEIESNGYGEHGCTFGKGKRCTYNKRPRTPKI